MSRTRNLSLYLFEGLRLMEQGEEQPLPQQQQAPLPEPAPQTVPSQTGTVPTSATGEPLTVDSLIDRLNVTRGGKSLTDPEIYGQLTTLYKNIPDEEKVIIDKTLSDIGKIVINVADQQPSPEQAPPAQQMMPQQQAPMPTQQAPQQAAPVAATPPIQ